MARYIVGVKSGLKSRKTTPCRYCTANDMSEDMPSTVGPGSEPNDTHLELDEKSTTLIDLSQAKELYEGLDRHLRLTLFGREGLNEVIVGDTTVSDFPLSDTRPRT